MIHPIETRYGRQNVRNIFEEENKLQRMLDVEAALARAHAKVGNIPRADAKAISAKALTKYVSVERVKEIEAEINHDIAALVQALAEQAGDAGRHVHLGATSNDITDTGLALQLKEYVAILEEDLINLRSALVKQAKETRDLVCVGRTHAQHAVPTTYGLKFGIWAMELDRHVTRLAQVEERLLVGQMSGAVGTQAALGRHARKIQELVMKDLGLGVAQATNQVIQRDMHAEFMQLLALIAQTLNKIGTEVRNLQRTEIDEVAEGFGKKQVGSSTMPHKRNPIHAERICGLARIIKANSQVALDNMPLWHERDLTNSSPERIIIPEACILTDYILNLTIDVIQNMVFNMEKIGRNLNMTQGRIMAESVMTVLVEKGADRQEAHALLRDDAMMSFHKNKEFRDVLVKDEKVMAYLTESELDDALDPEKYVGTAPLQVDEIVRKLG